MRILLTGLVYGGIMDIALALCPWFIVRGLLLDLREKIGLAVAMSLGALTGIVVILRAFILWLLEKNDASRRPNLTHPYLPTRLSSAS